MGGLISPKQPQQTVQPIIEEEAPEVEQRDVNDIDALRRRRQQPSLLEILSDGSQTSPTIL